jgi:hypothetical protein
MDIGDTISLDGVDVTVTETPGALTFTIVSNRAPRRPNGCLALVLVAVGVPLGLLALVVYALVRTEANRPEWELALTGLFVVQLVWWLGTTGGGAIRFGLGLGFRPLTLRFTAAHVYHGGDWVCELAEVRGLRLFTYREQVQYLSDLPLPRDTSPVPDKPPIPPELAPMPPDARPPEKTEAGLSLVIGDEGQTHGLLSGFDPAAVRAFADALQLRLAAFRFNQGILAPLDPVAQVETTSQEVWNVMNTRPPVRRIRLFSAAATIAILGNPWLCLLWCAAMLAGLYGSGRLILAAGLRPTFLIGHLLLGAIHVLLLLAALDRFIHGAEKGGKTSDQ